MFLISKIKIIVNFFNFYHFCMIFFNIWLEIDIYRKIIFHREVYFSKTILCFYDKKNRYYQVLNFFHKKVISPHCAPVGQPYSSE